MRDGDASTEDVEDAPLVIAVFWIARHAQRYRRVLHPTSSICAVPPLNTIEGPRHVHPAQLSVWCRAATASAARRILPLLLLLKCDERRDKPFHSVAVHHVWGGVLDKGVERQALPGDLHLAVRQGEGSESDDAPTREQDVPGRENERRPGGRVRLARNEGVVLSVADVGVQGVARLGRKDRPKACL